MMMAIIIIIVVVVVVIVIVVIIIVFVIIIVPAMMINFIRHRASGTCWRVVFHAGLSLRISSETSFRNSPLSVRYSDGVPLREVDYL